MKENQENQGWGGKRPGSGRPKGSTNYPKLSDDLTEEQKATLVKTSYEKAIEGDSKLLQFFLEQIYGKARQSIGLDGGADGLPLEIRLISYANNDSSQVQSEEVSSTDSNGT